MDDLYSFGKEKYIPADPIQRSILLFVKNLVFVVVAAVKCTFLGIFIIFKSILFIIVPRFSKDIQYQVALITGGANGIGFEIGIELARCGCNIAVADIDMDGAREAVEEFHLLGVKAFAYEVDVANYDEIVALKEKIKIDLGEVDILVNSAGLLPNVSLLEGNSEDLLRIIKVNLLAYFWTIRVFLPGMISRRRGHIVGISSITGYESNGHSICDSSTKFGIRGLMDGLYELSRLNNLNINVTTVFPPLVNTRKSFVDQFKQADGSLNPATELVFYTPEEVAVATVDAIVKNKQYVSLPFFLRKIVIFAQLLPEQLRNLIRDNFKFPQNSQNPSTNEKLPKQIPKVYTNGSAKNGTVNVCE